MFSASQKTVGNKRLTKALGACLFFFFFLMGTSKKHAKGRLDKYYHMAKEQGYRARSAFKLIQLNKKFNFLEKAKVTVDLCAAPGSWSQVLSRRLYLPAVQRQTTAANASQDNNSPLPDAQITPLPRIVAIDLQPMAPIEGVTQLQGDITSERTAAEVIAYFDGGQADLVVCDGAPDG